MKTSAAARARADASETICSFTSTLTSWRGGERLALRIRMPQAKSAFACIFIAAGNNSWRKFGDPPGIASAQHDIVSLQRVLQLRDDVEYRLHPLLLSL